MDRLTGLSLGLLTGLLIAVLFGVPIDGWTVIPVCVVVGVVR